MPPHLQAALALRAGRAAGPRQAAAVLVGAPKARGALAARRFASHGEGVRWPCFRSASLFPVDSAPVSAPDRLRLQGGVHNALAITNASPLLQRRLVRRRSPGDELRKHGGRLPSHPRLSTPKRWARNLGIRSAAKRERPFDNPHPSIKESFE